jgi:hypothetical protein
MTHDEIREQLEGYALGVLDPEEERQVVAHLSGCEECRQTVAGYERVADALPGALAEAAPAERSPSARRRVLAHASASANGPRWWPRLALAMAGAALVVAAAVALLWGVRANQALAQERALYAALAGQQEIVFDVVDSVESRRVILTSPDQGSTSYGKVFTRPDLPYVVAMCGRLPPAPEGQAYQLWLYDGSRVTFAGILPVTNQGFGALVYTADHVGLEFDRVTVTLQPASANAAPRGHPVLIWTPS